MSAFSGPLAEAYAACERLASAHYENFPVASWLLPAPMRPHIAAVYAFARKADDMADEGVEASSIRQERLRAWQHRLHEAAEGELRLPGHTREDDLLFIALGHTIRTHVLPVSLFDDLLSAFGQDTMKDRYDSWEEVFDYCRRSANPVGRLVLRISGHVDPALDRSSDALCTALQLTNFWQDFGRDWRAGRLYVPWDVQQACGADVRDLDGDRMSTEWARAIHVCAGVTRREFDQGRMVCEGVTGRLGLELRLTWQGGRRVLEMVEQSAHRLLHYRPKLGAVDLPLLLWRTASWRNGSGNGA
ncbi:MAG: squalene synthase HpnC [Vicinamibacterales bacterium]